MAVGLPGGLEVRDGWQFIGVGQNLFDGAHGEFPDGANGLAEIERSLTIGLRWSR